jgi:hypothetical protein
MNISSAVLSEWMEELQLLHAYGFYDVDRRVDSRARIEALRRKIREQYLRALAEEASP